jgi:hypothetical protein
VPPAVEPPALPPDRPFARVLPNFWTDLRRFPSVDTAVVLGIGAAMAGVAYKNDEYFTAHSAAGGTDQIFAVGGTIGGGYVNAGIALGTYAAGRLTKRNAVAHVGADLIRAQLLTGVLTHTVKAISRRARPTGEQESSTDTYSFPSAHASASWTSATVLWRHLGWKVGVPATLLAAFGSAARLQQNQHYMSDVLVGAAIGVASARTVTVGHRARCVSVGVVPLSGGGAVMFSILPR